MRASFRTFALLLAFALALIALPSVVMAAGGQSLSATVATAFGAPVDLEPVSYTHLLDRCPQAHPARV